MIVVSYKEEVMQNKQFDGYVLEKLWWICVVHVFSGLSNGRLVMQRNEQINQ